MTQKKLKIPKNDTFDKTVSVKIKHKTYDEIYNLAKLNNSSVSTIIRVAIEQFINDIL